jgi:shikimate dehydrogenase
MCTLCNAGKSQLLTEAVNGSRSLNFRGFNVTLPHQTNILSLLDTLDKDAQAIGAVNTVVNTNG